MRSLILSSVVVTSLIAAPVVAGELAVGAAVVDITPPIGYRMAGYFSERLSTGMHDPLLAKALVLGDGNSKLALVCCDLIGVPASVTSAARKLVEQQSGIPGGHVMITATHSHTGPMYKGTLRQHFRERAIEQHGKDPHETVDYATQLAEKIAEAVSSADRSARPAAMAAGFGEQSGLSFNRRFHMKDGKVQMNPGKLNPEIVRTAGPIDPEVGLLMFRETRGDKPIGSLTVFALHLDTVGGTEYSGDFPYYLAEGLKREHGEKFVSLFGAGTCGDINHIDVSHDRPQKGQEEAERIGTALASTVIDSLVKLEPAKEIRFEAATETVTAETPKYSEERIEQAKRDIAKTGTRELTFLEQVETSRVLGVASRGGKLPLEVQAFRLADDVAVVGLPGEVFVELGLAIKRASPFATTLVIELANDDPAYIPTKKAFAEGSYETVNSLITPGTGETLVEAATKLLQELKRAK